MTEFADTSAGDRIGFDRYGEGPGVVFVAGAGPLRATDATTTETARLVAEHGVQTLVYDRLGRGDSEAQGDLTLERDVLHHLDAGDLEAAQVEYMRDMPPEFLEQSRAMPEWPQIAAGSRTYRADARSLAWAEERGPAERFARITVPVLTMVGAQTFPGMTETAEMLAAVIPSAMVRVMPGAWHDWEPAPMALALAELAAKG